MAQINFRKFVTKKDVLAVINNLIDALDASLWIEDADGKRLSGLKSETFTHKFPVELSGEVIGWVIGEEKATAVASLLSYLAKQESDKKRLANELLDKYQEIDLLQDISTQITASLNLPEVVQLVIEEAGKLIQSTQGSILLLNQKTGFFETLSEFGQSSCFTEPQRLGQGLIGTIVQTGNGEIINDVSADPRFVNCTEPVKSLICVPLKTKDQVIGALTVSSKTSVTYSAADLKLLTMLALQAAIAIEKAILYEQSCTAAIVAQEQAQQLQSTLDELQQTQAQLIQSEKMSSLGQLVAGVAHEINNPINFIYGNFNHAHQYTQDLLHLLRLYTEHYPQPIPDIQKLTETIDLDFLVNDLPKLLTSMKLGVDRIRSIVSSLRNFSRLDQAEMKPVNLHEGIDSTLLILQHRLKATAARPAIQVIKDYSQLPLVECYASQLNQVFINIISYSIEALESSQSWKSRKFKKLEKFANLPTCEPDNLLTPLIRIRTEVFDTDHIVICIQDNSPGITESVKEKLFQPCYTTQSIGKGTGLGLSISYQIVVEKHGGILKCFSQPGGGTEFWIQIPVTPSLKRFPKHREQPRDNRTLSVIE